MHPDQERYQRWLNQNSGLSLDFTILLNGIWELLCSETTGPETEVGIWHLICFIQKVRPAQNNLIRDLCQRHRQDFWETLTSRAAGIYARLKPQLNILNGRIQQGSEAFYGYFYRVLENNLILCNKEAIDELWQKEGTLLPDLVSADDGLGDVPDYRGLRSNPSPPQPLTEILADLEARDRARELYERLREDWQPRHLNALCHYYEVLSGLPTQRLTRETNANIDQIHSRLRHRLLAYIADKGFSKESARLFCALWLPQLCQETPALETYRVMRSV